MRPLRDRPFNLQRGLWFFASFRNFFRTTRELGYLFFFLEFNIRLYDENSESDYFFFLHQNQIIFFSSIKIRIFFSATLGIRIHFCIFLEKKHTPPPPPPPPFKLNGRSLIRKPFCYA